MKNRPLSRFLVFTMAPLLSTAQAAQEDALAIMDNLARMPNEVRLKASIETAEGATSVHHVGDGLRFNVQASTDAYIYIVRVDSNGVGWLTIPPLGRGNLLRGNAPGTYPSNREQAAPVARPPLGPMTTYVIATPRPIDRGATPVNTDPETEIGVAKGDFEAFVRKVLDASDSRPLGVVRLDHEIKPRKDGPQFTASDLVAYFTTTTRAIQRPKISADIRFDFNSARLTPEARKNLSQWGKALSDPRLKDKKFRVTGHTDDIGTEEINKKLSWSRAATVKRHLEKEHGIEPERLTIQAMGESAPLMPGTSDEARAANRRVEFEMNRN